MGAELAQGARTFDNIMSPHASILKNEYKSDYQQEWPGCSETDQWSAVNWENQVYVNSKDPNITSQCKMKKAGALAGLMSHEIFHVKAGSNYCANERNCLFQHELLAHIYERIVQREHDNNPETEASITIADIKQLSNQVFKNYIESTVNSDSDKEYSRLYSEFLDGLRRVGWDNKKLGVNDVDLMLRIGKESLLNNQFYNGRKSSTSKRHSIAQSFLDSTTNSAERGYHSTKSSVFYNGKPLTEVNPISFTVLKNDYARDADNVFFQGKNIASNGRTQFRILHGTVATDNRNIFVQGKVLQKFQPMDSIAGSRRRSATRQRIRRLRAKFHRKLTNLLMS